MLHWLTRSCSFAKALLIAGSFSAHAQTQQLAPLSESALQHCDLQNPPYINPSCTGSPTTDGPSGELSSFWYQEAMGLHHAGEYAEALELLIYGRASGDSESTRVLAWYTWHGLVGPQDEVAALLFMEEAALRSSRAKTDLSQLRTLLAQRHEGEAVPETVPDRELTSEAALALSLSMEKMGIYTQARRYGILGLVLRHQETQPLPNDILLEGSDPSTLDPEQTLAEYHNDLHFRAFGGDVDAMYTLANLIAIGDFPARNPDHESLCWLSAAARLGHRRSARESVLLQGGSVSVERYIPDAQESCMAHILGMIKARKEETFCKGILACDYEVNESYVHDVRSGLD